MSDVTGATPSAAGSSPASSSPAVSSSSSSVEATPASASVTPTAAVESGAAPSSPSAVPSEPGPVPYGRFKEVNEQLRVAKEFQSKYERLSWAEQFEQNPYAFVDSWVDQLAAHPEHQTKILAKAAKLLNSRRGQSQAAAEMPKPDVPIMDGNGNITGYTYSDKQLQARDEFVWSQRQSALDERLGPLEQQMKTQQQREQMAALQQQSWQQAADTLTEMRQNPYFKEHEAKVKQALAAHEEWGDNIHAAFNHVLVTEILPTLSQTEQRKVVESLQQKAGASTVGPGGGGAATPKKFKSFSEAIAHYQAHPDEAEAMAHR